METLQRIQNLIRQVATEEIMPRFLHSHVNVKNDGTLMTEADLASQQALIAGLQQIIAAPALGEEMSSDAQRQLWQNNPDGLWVIDPIDGTTNFASGIPHFAVSVAFMKNGQSEIGVTFDPFCDEMFYAKKGSGAFLNKTALPLRRHTCSSLRDTVAAVEVKYLRSGTLANRMQSLSPCRSQRNMGCSTLDWCYLASGRFDVFLHGGQKLWDYAAGSLIATEAGGQLATLEGDDFWSGKHTFKRSVIAAIEPKLFTAWLKWVRDNQ